MKIFTVALALAENGVNHAMRGLAKPGTWVEYLRRKSTLEGPRSWGSGRPHSACPPTSDTLRSLKHNCPRGYSSLEEKKYKTHTHPRPPRAPTPPPRCGSLRLQLPHVPWELTARHWTEPRTGQGQGKEHPGGPKEKGLLNLMTLTD